MNYNVGEVVFVLETVVVVVLAAAMYSKARTYEKTGSSHVVRKVLNKFGQLWLGFLAYSLLKPSVQGVGPYADEASLFLVVTLSTYTNYILYGAILIIERHLAVPADTGSYKILDDYIKSWVLAAGYLLSSALVVFSGILPGSVGAFELFAIGIQMAISIGLLVWMANTFKELERKFLNRAFMIYAGIEFVYLLGLVVDKLDGGQTLPVGFSEDQFSLLVRASVIPIKLFIGLSVFLKSDEIEAKLKRVTQNMKPIELWSNAEIAIRSACKTSTSVVLGVVVPTVLAGFGFGIYALIQLPMELAWKIALCLVFGFVVWLAVQRVILGAVLTRKRELDWTKLSESGMLPDGIKHEERNLPLPSWKWEIFSREKTSSGNLTFSLQRRDVVLLHGFGSSGRRAWGTLPVMLLDHKKVRNVHVVSFPAHSVSKIPFNGVDPDRLVRELRSVLVMISGMRDGGIPAKITIFAHSFGGMLAAAVVGGKRDNTVRPEEGRLYKKIHKLVCIMSPVDGVTWARLSWPWRFPYSLRPGSRFTTDSANGMRRLVTEEVYGVHNVELWLGSQDMLVNVSKLNKDYFKVTEEVLGEHSTWSSLTLDDNIQLDCYNDAIDDDGETENEMFKIGCAVEVLSSNFSYIICGLKDNCEVSDVKRCSDKYDADKQSYFHVLLAEYKESNGGEDGWAEYRKTVDAAICSMTLTGRNVVRINRANKNTGTILFIRREFLLLTLVLGHQGDIDGLKRAMTAKE